MAAGEHDEDFRMFRVDRHKSGHMAEHKTFHVLDTLEAAAVPISGPENS
jgi:hypothetical protein